MKKKEHESNKTSDTVLNFKKEKAKKFSASFFKGGHDREKLLDAFTELREIEPRVEKEKPARIISFEKHRRKRS